jgi:hypothetical protein
MMKMIRILFAIAVLTGLAGASTRNPIPATASPGTGYALAWSSQDGGGAVSQAGSSYAVSGAIAQPDAQVWSGSRYRLQGGFWQDWLRRLFLPVVVSHS